MGNYSVNEPAARERGKCTLPCKMKKGKGKVTLGLLTLHLEQGQQGSALLHLVPVTDITNPCGVRTWPEGASEHATIVTGSK